jgi:hypothetical protein
MSDDRLSEPPDETLTITGENAQAHVGTEAALPSIVMELFGLSRAQVALWSFAILVTLALGTAVADAMVETDVERLEEVGRVLGRTDQNSRIDGLLAWADPEREPVYVSAGRAHHRIDGDGDLSGALREVLEPLDHHGALAILQDDVEIHGETGTVSIGARVDGDRVDVTLTLRREGQGWLLSGVRSY